MNFEQEQHTSGLRATYTVKYQTLYRDIQIYKYTTYLLQIVTKIQKNATKFYVVNVKRNIRSSDISADYLAE